MLKFVYIQNFELILDILEHPKPSIAILKQAGWVLFGKNSNMFGELFLVISVLQ